jgi:excisionase family DNA binding protein
MTKLLNVNQVADSLGLKPSTIRAWIAQRRIAVARIGRSVRVPEDEIRRLIEEGTIPARKQRNGR